jgi:hypothetical protein
MSNTKNSFELNLTSDTALTSITATFDAIDNIQVDDQDLYTATIGSVKVLFGIIDVTSTQNNKIWGHHTINFPADFFSTVISYNLTMTGNTSYQVSAHGGDTTVDSIAVYYNQGQDENFPGSGRLNILVIGA